jgi:glyoxylase-like metal-dependent hydrolase (beta-lactamase superfamily II)
MADIIAGVPARLSALVTRITAPNPGMMTGPGTNSYLIGSRELAVIDPGPESDTHLAALLREAAGRVKWILCTHTHRDHSPGARALKAATGAQVVGFGRAPDDGRQDTSFAADRTLGDEDVLDCGEFRLRAIHTPGHASNHLCYLLEGERWLFTGDHVMQGSTVVISPPDGDMAVYLKSLERLLALDLAVLAPGHGHIIETPHHEVRRLIAHRLKRERKVLAALSRMSCATLDELLPVVYDDVAPRVHPVARRSLHAHLIKLEREGKASESAGAWKIVV